MAIVEVTTFGVIDSACKNLREVKDSERLYIMDVLGVEDRGENDQLNSCVVVRRKEGMKSGSLGFTRSPVEKH